MTEEVKKEEEGTEEEVVKKDVYETVKRDMLEERSKRRELEIQLKEREEEQQPQEESIAMDANAKADIAMKIAIDPSFKARHELVQDEMLSSGATLEEADARIKSKLYDKLVEESATTTTEQPINKQINTQATPEPVVQQPTGDALADALNNEEVSPEIKSALQSRFADSERLRSNG